MCTMSANIAGSVNLHLELSHLLLYCSSPCMHFILFHRTIFMALYVILHNCSCYFYLYVSVHVPTINSAFNVLCGMTYSGCVTGLETDTLPCGQIHCTC